MNIFQGLPPPVLARFGNLVGSWLMLVAFVQLFDTLECFHGRLLHTPKMLGSTNRHAAAMLWQTLILAQAHTTIQPAHVASRQRRAENGHAMQSNTSHSRFL